MTRTKLIKLVKQQAKVDMDGLGGTDKRIVWDSQLMRIYQRKCARIEAEKAEIQRVATLTRSLTPPHPRVRSTVLREHATLFTPAATEALAALCRLYTKEMRGESAQAA